MDEKDREVVDSYRASHPECRWCVHNMYSGRGRSACRVKDVEMRSNAGLVGKMRARLCSCYSIK